MGRMINRRRVCGGKNLPYDAEIEYLESTGTQYIDTLFKGNTTTTTLNITLMTLKPAIGGYQGLFGSRNVSGGATLASANVFGEGGTSFRIDWAKGAADPDTNVPCSPNIIYNIEVTRGYFKINDTVYNFSDRTSINQDYNFLIGSFSNGSSGPYGNGFIGRIYLAKLYSNNKLIIDLIPVRVGQVGYMYDKVSKQLFGNAGTGSFILGPDK